MKHTPGPWTSEGSLIIKFGSDGRAICIIADSRGETTSDVCPIKLDDPDWKGGMANARLIAAAPDLLKALEYIMEDMKLQEFYGFSGELAEYPEIVQKHMDAARAALAKAKGEVEHANG